MAASEGAVRVKGMPALSFCLRVWKRADGEGIPRSFLPLRRRPRLWGDDGPISPECGHTAVLGLSDSGRLRLRQRDETRKPARFSHCAGRLYPAGWHGYWLRRCANGVDAMVSVIRLPPPPSARCPCKRFPAWANAVIAGMLPPLLSNRGCTRPWAWRLLR